MRKFEEVKEEFKKFPNVPTQMPVRSTGRSAGYDFKSKEDFTLLPNTNHIFWTDVKAIMYFDNVLNIYTRSGNGCKYGIVLRNGTGVIDADYQGNANNDGNIGICLVNEGSVPFEVHIGDRIAQGIFIKYYVVDDDKYLNNETETLRTGGFGSSGK